MFLIIRGYCIVCNILSISHYDAIVTFTVTYYNDLFPNLLVILSLILFIDIIVYNNVLQYFLYFYKIVMVYCDKHFFSRPLVPTVMFMLFPI